ncbi:MAG: NYN domain-containing protein [Candidatus Dormibacteraeota bacterium]|nr:NYN domain-containing protein [Candidatus Dormibacteraeota bacterium]
MQQLVVDGYNVIHAWPTLQSRFREHGMQSARDLLVQHLSEYAAHSGVTVTVVFDAHARVSGDPSRATIDGVTVMYGTRDLSADHVIERLANRAARAGAAHEMVVATNDRLQRAVVGAMGVAGMSVRGLSEELERVRAETSAAGERMRTEHQRTSRLEHRIDPETAARLERLRRGESDGV